MFDFKRYILWIQSNNSESEDVIIVDGENVRREFRQTAFSYIFPSANSEWRLITRNITKHLSEGITSSLCMYQNNVKDVLIISNFVTLDNQGRRIAFMFCSKNDDIGAICDLLVLCTTNLHYEVNAKDIEYLKQKVQPNNKRRTKGIFISITVIIALSIIWKIITCQN